MKRLLKISLDLFLLSFIPILSWFCLSLTIDKNLINIFTVTYPLQFIYFILRSIFSTGANICKEKDKNNNVVMSGIIIGSLVGLLIFGFIIIRVEDYIRFMNMDISIYKTFTIYSIVQLFFQLIFSFILNKLYYDNKNTLANKYSIIYNLLNFVVLVMTSLITKNQIVIISTTLISIGLFILYVLIKSWDTFKFNFNIFKCIKYDSVELFNNIAFFLIFLFGLSNALEYGEKYALALTFIALITDTQWDTFDAIKDAAQIDISKNKFNYREHKNNAYKLLSILLLSIFLMFGCLYWFYDLDIVITLIYLLFELLNFIIYPVYRLQMCYLQLEWSALKTTICKISSSILRMFASLINTPYCTGIGQIVSSVYQFIVLNIIFRKNYIVNKEGFIERRL